jgi:hypothetical protein
MFSGSGAYRKETLLIMECGRWPIQVRLPHFWMTWLDGCQHPGSSSHACLLAYCSLVSEWAQLLHRWAPIKLSACLKIYPYKSELTYFGRRLKDMLVIGHWTAFAIYHPDVLHLRSKICLQFSSRVLHSPRNSFESSIPFHILVCFISVFLLATFRLLLSASVCRYKWSGVWEALKLRHAANFISRAFYRATHGFGWN